MESTSNPKLVISSIAVISALGLAIVFVVLKKGEHGHPFATTLRASDSAATAGVGAPRHGRPLTLPAARAPAGNDATEVAVAEPPLDEEEAPAGDVRPAPPPEAFANPGPAATSNTGTGLVFTAPPVAEAVDVKKKANTPAGEAQTVPAGAAQPQAPVDVLPPTSPDAFENPGERPARNRDSGLVFGTPPKTAEGLK